MSNENPRPDLFEEEKPVLKQYLRVNDFVVLCTFDLKEFYSFETKSWGMLKEATIMTPAERNQLFMHHRDVIPERSSIWYPLGKFVA
jgi:hypothetical protein